MNRGVIINAVASLACTIVAVGFGAASVIADWTFILGTPLAGYVGFRFAQRAIEWSRR
jgi:hypothetical protein